MPFERIYTGIGEQGNAISAAYDKEVTRGDMVDFYLDCLIAHYQGKPVDFALVNQAILKRWPKGLTFIKNRAWAGYARLFGPMSVK